MTDEDELDYGPLEMAVRKDIGAVKLEGGHRASMAQLAYLLAREIDQRSAEVGISQLGKLVQELRTILVLLTKSIGGMDDAGLGAHFSTPVWDTQEPGKADTGA